LARGCKRPKHRLLCPVDLLAYLEIVFIDKSAETPPLMAVKERGLNLLTECALKDNFQPLRADLNRLNYGLYVAEFLNRITALEDPNPELFRLALKTLRQLASPDASDSSTALFAFETQALKILGYVPHPQGRALLFQRMKTNISGIEGIAKLFETLAHSKLPDLNRLKINAPMHKGLRRFLDYYIASITGEELRTAKLL
ncbi:MAG: DNA repair protein RecO C-terminal domain-containing protein, partial [Planctomycetes bacterium]|nr:DNA repair protein RecO C-terminal domain-containing protein [Planctomycetota bacterium]